MRTRVIAMAIGLLPLPAAADEDFSMPVMDVFSITGSGIVATGQVASGSIAKGDVVCIVSATGGERHDVAVAGIEQFRKILETASAGEHIGLLLSGVSKGEVVKGDEIRGNC